MWYSIFPEKKMPGPAKCSVDGLYLFQHLHISWRLNSKSQYHNSQFPHKLIWEVYKILKASSTKHLLSIWVLENIAQIYPNIALNIS